MFEVGQRYEFRMLEDGAEVLFWGEIEKYEHPLIKLKDPSPVRVQIGLGVEEEDDLLAKPATVMGNISGQIINVTSHNFVSARRESKR